MGRWKVPADVAALIRGLHPDLQRKVRAAPGDIYDDPAIGKLLRDELAGLRSCRVSRFRIVYRVVGATIEIIAVGPRRSIDRETWRRVRKMPRSP